MDERKIYPDVLRVLAIGAVIVLHVASKNMWAYNVGDIQFEILTLWCSLTKWAVPIFIMISGAFLLDENKSISKTKLVGYCRRIVISFFGWSFVYALWNKIISYEFVWHNFSISEMWSNFYMGPYHFWYMYVILGLYLILPFLRKCLSQCDKKEIEYMLILFFLFSIVVPILQRFEIFAFVLYWVESMKISSISGYIGLFILGYYLRKYGEQIKIKKQILLIIFVFALVFMIIFTFICENKTGLRDDFWQGCFSIWVIIQAVCLFQLSMSCEDWLVRRKASTKNIIVELSKNSFGVYLCHDMFISLLWRVGIDTIKYNSLWSVGLISITVMIMSYVFIIFLKWIWKNLNWFRKQQRKKFC